MNRLARRRPFEVAAGLILAVLFGGATASAAPAPGCAGHGITWVAGMRLRDALAELDRLAREAGPDAPIAPRPCTGPSCSGSPGVPVAPGVAAPGGVGDRWCVLPTGDRPAGGDADRSTAHEPPVRPTRRGLAILRPPRPGRVD